MLDFSQHIRPSSVPAFIVIPLSMQLLPLLTNLPVHLAFQPEANHQWIILRSGSSQQDVWWFMTE